MKILVLGAAGFIGTNLSLELCKNEKDEITLFDQTEVKNPELVNSKNIKIIKDSFVFDSDFEILTREQDVVYHLISSTVPTTSNQHIPQELVSNVIVTSKLLEACVKNRVKKIIFLSSGGTVYGKEKGMPLKEDTATYPITSYGIQKITIEKLLYLYHYMYGLDYRVIRLSNPYGPYQRPNGIQGVITTFVYNALQNKELNVYGNGEVVRDYIYIDDAIKGILAISEYCGAEKTFNLGSEIGHSINQIIELIRNVLETEVVVNYEPARKVDVPVNILDMSLYHEKIGDMKLLSLEDGIRKTALFMKSFYQI